MRTACCIVYPKGRQIPLTRFLRKYWYIYMIYVNKNQTNWTNRSVSICAVVLAFALVRSVEAMNMALSASDLPLVMWLCGRLDPEATPSTLPQHVLLCLVQQFGASDLLEDTVSTDLDLN